MVCSKEGSEGAVMIFNATELAKTLEPYRELIIGISVTLLTLMRQRIFALFGRLRVWLHRNATLRASLDAANRHLALKATREAAVSQFIRKFTSTMILRGDDCIADMAELLKFLLGSLPDLVSGTTSLQVGLFKRDDGQAFAVHTCHNYSRSEQQTPIGSDSLIGEAFTAGHEIYCPDRLRHGKYRHKPHPVSDSRTTLCIPLYVSSELAGVLVIDAKNPNALTDEDIAVVRFLADLVVLCLTILQRDS